MTLLNELIKIEDGLDVLNGNYGDINNYCIWCETKRYTGDVGLIHSNTCVMTQIRDKIKELTQ